MASDDDFLVLEGLTKRYGSNTVVDELHLAIGKGEFISLLGPSGCGKTTTLQMIAGFVDPSAGRVRLRGADLTSVPPNRRQLGIVFQSYALFPHYTAAENVAFGLEMRGIPKTERSARVAEALALVGLAGLADRYPRRMSGGQQQRVALARALVINPSVLLLDEPLSNLDAKLREELQAELRAIQRRIGTTTLLVTHDQAEAMALSNRIVVMNEGRVEQVGAPEDVYARPASAFVAGFLGKTNVFTGRILANDGTSMLIVDGESYPMSGSASQGPVTVQVRPERIRLETCSGKGLKARVVSRVFQGASWLYNLETRAGPVIVLSHNDGATTVPEGAEVRLSWNADDMSVSPAGGR
ncbi:MAG: ABC transporter ATP-binding protein [Burkholderiaceae bacterium]